MNTFEKNGLVKEETHFETILLWSTIVQCTRSYINSIGLTELKTTDYRDLIGQ